MLFVHDGDAARGRARRARGARDDDARRRADGIVFRTDADLRPEGRRARSRARSTATRRTTSGGRRTWEFQALIKARPVAGDAELGARFIELHAPVRVARGARPRRDPRDPGDEGARRGRSPTRKGLGDRELKRGRGGIRDIEFAVQLLQLVHGRDDASVRQPDDARSRSPSSPTAGYVDRARRRPARRARTGSCAPSSTGSSSTTSSRPTPSRPTTRRAPASRACSATATAASAPRSSAFDAEHRAHQRTVRTHPRTALLRAAARDARRRRATSRPKRPRNGSPRSASPTSSAPAPRSASSPTASPGARGSCSSCCPLVLEWLSATPDPDLGLLQLRRLAEGPARSASLATTLPRRARAPPSATCHAARVEPRVVGDALRRHPEFVDALDDDDALGRETHARRAGRRRARARSSGGGDAEQRREGLRRFKRRELLRIATPRPARARAARDDRARAHRARRGVPRGRAAVARAAAAVRGHRHGPPRRRRALVRVRHRRDVRVRRRPRGRLRRRRARRDARSSQEIGATTAGGPDLPRSTPGSGPRATRARWPARSAGSARYYERVGPHVGAPGAHQGAVRRRRPRRSASASAQLADDVVYGQPFTDDDVREVRRMKARIERERIPTGRGSAVPPEARARLAVRRRVHACSCSSSRTAATTPSCGCPARSTRSARCATTGCSTTDDADVLEEAYRFCERARNALLPPHRPSRRRAPERPRRDRAARAAARLRAPAAHRRCATTTAASRAGRVGSSNASSTPQPEDHGRVQPPPGQPRRRAQRRARRAPGPRSRTHRRSPPTRRSPS